MSTNTQSLRPISVGAIGVTFPNPHFRAIFTPLGFI